MDICFLGLQDPKISITYIYINFIGLELDSNERTKVLKKIYLKEGVVTRK